MIVTMDVSSKGVAYYVTDINKWGWLPLTDQKDPDGNLKLDSLIAALGKFNAEFKPYGQMRVFIEAPATVASSPGAAASSAKATAFSYAAWGLLSAEHKHNVTMIHNMSWKMYFKMACEAEDEDWKPPKGGIRSKADINAAMQDLWPAKVRTIQEGTKKGHRQDVMDATAMAIGIEHFRGS